MASRQTRTTKGRGRYHHGDLRRALIEASLELIGEQGLSALTLRGVARRLGVSHAAPQHHFADKTELLTAVAIEGFEALAKAQREAAGRVTDPWDRFKRLGNAYVSFALTHPSQFRVMFSRDLTEASPPLLREYWKAGSQVLKDAAAEAVATHGSANKARARTAAVAAWSLVHGLAALWLDGPLRQLIGSEASDDEFASIARKVTDFVVDSVERGL